MGLQHPRRWYAGFLCLMGFLYPLCKTRGPPHKNWGEPQGKTTLLMRTKVRERVRPVSGTCRAVPLNGRAEHRWVLTQATSPLAISVHLQVPCPAACATRSWVDGVPQEPKKSGFLGTALPLMAPEAIDNVPALGE